MRDHPTAREFVAIGQARVVLVATTVGIAVLNKERGGQWTGVDMVEVYITRETQTYLSTLARCGDDRWEVQMLGALPFFSLFTFSTFSFFLLSTLFHFSQLFSNVSPFFFFPLLSFFFFSFSPRSPCSPFSSFSPPFSPLPPPFLLLSSHFSPFLLLFSPFLSLLFPLSPLPLFPFVPLVPFFPFFPFSHLSLFTRFT